MKTNHLFLLFALSLICSRSVAQFSTIYETRLVVLNHGDSAVHLNILVNNSTIKILNDRVYYWYTSDYMHANQGGYSGYLLHGSYKVFDKNNHLLVQGTFYLGLKSGTWKTWYASGQLAALVNYKSGELHGPFQYFEATGKETDHGKYQHGKKVEKPVKNNLKKHSSENPTEVIITPGDSINTKKPVQ